MSNTERPTRPLVHTDIYHVTTYLPSEVRPYIDHLETERRHWRHMAWLYRESERLHRGWTRQRRVYDTPPEDVKRPLKYLRDSPNMRGKDEFYFVPTADDWMDTEHAARVEADRQLSSVRRFWRRVAWQYRKETRGYKTERDELHPRNGSACFSSDAVILSLRHSNMR